MDEEFEDGVEFEDDGSEELEIDDELVELAEEMAELSDEELVELETRLIDEYNALRDTEDFANADGETLDAAESLLEALEFVHTEMGLRLEEDAASTRRDGFGDVKSAAGDFAARRTEGFAAEEDDGKDEAPVAVAGDADIRPDGLAGDKPKVAETFHFMTASADVPGIKAGQDLNSWNDVAKAFVAKRPTIRGTDKGNDGYRYLVASMASNFPEERYLGADTFQNMERIAAVTGPEALVASGGFCAPLTPYYPLQTWGDTGRPVRDALPAFKADRGGIRFLPPPVLGDLAGSVRRTTATQDAAGYTNQSPAGTTAPKPCLHVTCESEDTAVVEAVSRCLTFGNLGARTYPEQVEAWLKLSMVEFSRYAEIELLDMIASESTAVTPAAQWGSATATLLEQITLAVTAFRARNRVMGEVAMRVMLPFWAKELIRTDISHQPPFDGLAIYQITDSMIDGFFSSRKVNVTWYQDNTTAAGAPFAAQTAGAQIDWPNTIVWFLYPEGAFLYLDGGSLDLGLVRDSTLNSQNDYQIWAEEFFSVVFLGTEAYKYTSTLCPNGRYGGYPESGTKPGC